MGHLGRLSTALLILLCACGPSGSGVHVLVGGAAVPGTDFDSVELQVSREDGSVLGLTHMLTGDLPPQLPFSVNLVSSGGLPAGTRVTVEVDALLSGQLRWTVSGEVSLYPGASQ